MTDLVLEVESATLTELIRDEIEDADKPDVVLIADRVRSALADEDVEEALMVGIRSEVDRIARSMRAAAQAQARRDIVRIEREAVERAKKVEAKEKLSAATIAHEKLIERRFFQTWKETATGRKFLGECTAEDLRYSRDQQRKRSDALLDASTRDERLALLLDEAKVSTVRELGYELAIQAYKE